VFDYDKNGNLLPSTLPNLSSDGKLMMIVDCEMMVDGVVDEMVSEMGW